MTDRPTEGRTNGDIEQWRDEPGEQRVEYTCACTHQCQCAGWVCMIFLWLVCRWLVCCPSPDFYAASHTNASYLFHGRTICEAMQPASQDRQSYVTLRFRCTNCISKRNIVIESEESLLCKNLIIIMSTALDRFVYITYPLHYHIIMTNRRGKQILISIWVSLSCQLRKRM